MPSRHPNPRLDPILIFGLGPVPALGVEGAAIATTIGRGAGVLMQLWMLIRGGQHLRVLRSHVVWHGAILWSIVRTSLGGIGHGFAADAREDAHQENPRGHCLGWQHSGVFWGVFISETSVGLFTLWLFTRGGWKTAQV